VTESPTLPVLARSAHDRIAHRRCDAKWVDNAWRDPANRVLVLSAAGTVTTVRGRLHLISVEQVNVNGERVLLGEADGIVYFAVLADTEAATADVASDWQGLRALAVGLDDLDVGLLTSAVALQTWHQRHVHCPRCGAVTGVTQAGWTRTCPEDSSEHFPRTDPARPALTRCRRRPRLHDPTPRPAIEPAAPISKTEPRRNLQSRRGSVATAPASPAGPDTAGDGCGFTRWRSGGGPPSDSVSGSVRPSQRT